MGVRCQCPVALSLVGGDTRWAADGLAAWGHQMGSLMVGLRAAAASCSSFLLDDDYWDGIAGSDRLQNAMAGRREGQGRGVEGEGMRVEAGESHRRGAGPKQGTRRLSEPWPWRIVRFNKSSSFSGANLNRVGWANSSSHSSHAQLARAHPDDLLRLGLGWSYARFMRSWQCGSWHHVHTGFKSCEVQATGHIPVFYVYCNPHEPGAWDQAVSSREYHKAVALFRAEIIKERHSRQDALGSPPVEIVWHLRTGDVQSFVNESALHHLNKSVLASGFKRRQTRHVVLSARQDQLEHRWPSFSTHWIHADEEEAVRLMAQADVLVTTGSSFSIAAAAVAPNGQLHLFGPPKEIPGKQLADARSHVAWQSYFMQRNTVPFDINGAPYQEYLLKLSHMLSSIDRSARAQPSTVWSSFEAFLGRNIGRVPDWTSSG
ncbi:MAG: hypothetical protein SGPRY_000618 [Prymnesium sp.]